MKKLISVLLAALMVLSSMTVVMAEDIAVTSIDLLTHKVNDANFLINGGIPPFDGVAYDCSSWSRGSIALPKNSVEDVTYRFAFCAPNGYTFEDALNGGNLEDYVLEFVVSKGCSKDYIENIEFGLGAANTARYPSFTSGSTYRQFPTIIKTTTFDVLSNDIYDSMDSSSPAVTISVPVKDIMAKDEQVFNVLNTSSGVNYTLPEYNASTINEFVMKFDCKLTTGSSSSPNVLKFTSIKLIKKTADITYNESEESVEFAISDYTAAPSVENNKAIVAYYNDEEGDGVYSLSYCDIVSPEMVDANNAKVSVPLDSTYMGSEKIRAFLFNSLSDITPLTKDMTIR